MGNPESNRSSSGSETQPEARPETRKQKIERLKSQDEKWQIPQQGDSAFLVQRKRDSGNRRIETDGKIETGWKIDSYDTDTGKANCSTFEEGILYTDIFSQEELKDVNRRVRTVAEWVKLIEKIAGAGFNLTAAGLDKPSPEEGGKEVTAAEFLKLLEDRTKGKIIPLDVAETIRKSLREYIIRGSD